MSKSWGDDDPENDLPPTYEGEPDANGVKTIIEYVLKEDGTKSKITRKVKVTEKTIRVNKKVAERKKWERFGECAGARPGPEQGITIVGDVIEFRAENQKKMEKEKEPTPVKTTGLGIVCRNCGAQGDHWTTKCPLRGKIVPVGDLTGADDDARDDGPRRFVVPARRGGGNMEGDSMKRRDETATVRVTNLSEDLTESDLQELFRPFGSIQRIFLKKDRFDPTKSMGYAFVNFTRRQDAATAIEKMSGVGFNHLILHCEWAKPSTRERA